jgi:hypothetical protein
LLQKYHLGKHKALEVVVMAVVLVTEPFFVVLVSFELVIVLEIMKRLLHNFKLDK